jgi:phosphotriesterase-related protein
MGSVQSYLGAIDAADLGWTLIHEHLFVRNFELERNYPDPEWSESEALERAVRGLETLHDLGVRTVVDLTVPGLGRDVGLISALARRVPVTLIASTGYYTADVLPVFFQFHGPGRVVDRADPLVDFFVRDIEQGIGDTGVKAAMLKVMTDRAGFTEDVVRVMDAAAIAHQRTGVTITTHSHPGSRNGLRQQALLHERGVPPERVIIGHSGDTNDLEYLMELMDNGSTIGMDRFGMEHILPDPARVQTVLALLRRGYADRMVLSHDAAFFSHVTPPSWRAREAPNWHMENLPRRVIPMLREGGASEADLEQLLVGNPRRLLEPSRRGDERPTAARRAEAGGRLA